MCSVKTECWLQKFWKSLRSGSMAKNVLRVDRLFWKHMHFLTSGSLVFLMGFGSLCLSPDTTLRTALTSTGTPLDDWSWHLAFLVGKGGFRYAPKRLPVWHRLRLEGLARVGQNHLCRFSRVFLSSCLRLTLANQMTERCSQAMLGHRSIHFVRVTSLKNPSTPLEYVHADPTASSRSSPSIFHVLPSSLSSTPSWSRRVQRVLNKCYEYKLAEEKWLSR